MEWIIEKRWGRMLQIYWLVVPFLLGSTLFLLALREQKSFSELLQHSPFVTASFLIASVMLLQAYIFHQLQQFSASKSGLLGTYLLFSTIQQVVVGNIPGAILCFLTRMNLSNEMEKEHKAKQIELTIFMLIISILSIIGIFSLLKLQGVI